MTNVKAKEIVQTDVTKIANETLDEMKSIEIYSKAGIVPSIYFNKITSSKNPSIKITKLSFSLIKQGQGEFVVSGVSKNRDGLVSFIEDLKTKVGFTSVESPVSDFAKDSDISFTLTIKLTL
jgi:hypothetical protein